jgi:MoxR-like ATPase
MADFKEIAESMIRSIETVIIGKRPQIITALATVFARGHILLEDVPGVAKTMLARTLAATLGCTFHRVQCTPDLLPTDVTGVSIFNQKTREFEFIRGPLFTNVLLADEINRTTPRTQSALLEAMEEKQISIDGTTYKLELPFLVIATQNPVDQEGTFPLPEAQLDRFLVKLSLGYPTPDEEAQMLRRMRSGDPLAAVKPVVSADAIRRMQDFVGRVFVHEEVERYLLRIVTQTRNSIKLALGASPRASIALCRAAQAIAALESRAYITPDDVKRLAQPVLAHRIILKPEYRLRRETPEMILKEIMAGIEAPTALTSFRGPGGGSAEPLNVTP